MPVDAGGNATRPPSPIPVSGQNADAPQVNVPINDIYAILNMLMFLDGRKPLRGNIPMNGHRARGAADAEQPQDYVTLAQLQALIMGLGVPAGVMEAYTISSSVAPSGWVFANGQSLARATFPNLWAAVQSGNNLAATEAAKTHGQYGPGDGSTTFTIPNLYADGGYFIRPMTSGRLIGSTQSDSFKSHTHTGATENDGEHSHVVNTASRNGFWSGSGNDQARVSNGNTNGNISTNTAVTIQNSGKHTHALKIEEAGGSETRPKNIAYPVIIKA